MYNYSTEVPHMTNLGGGLVCVVARVSGGRVYVRGVCGRVVVQEPDGISFWGCVVCVYVGG